MSIINHFISPYLYQQTVENFQLLPFTIGVYASCERESEKILPVSFSLPVLAGGTAADMFHAVDNTLWANNIPYHNLVGLSMDNAIANMGQHTSLRTMLTEQQPNLYVLVPETGSTNRCFMPRRFKSNLSG